MSSHILPRFLSETLMQVNVRTATFRSAMSIAFAGESVHRVLRLTFAHTFATATCSHPISALHFLFVMSHRRSA